MKCHICVVEFHYCNQSFVKGSFAVCCGDSETQAHSQLHGFPWPLMVIPAAGPSPFPSVSTTGLTTAFESISAAGTGTESHISFSLLKTSRIQNEQGLHQSLLSPPGTVNSNSLSRGKQVLKFWWPRPCFKRSGHDILAGGQKTFLPVINLVTWNVVVPDKAWLWVGDWETWREKYISHVKSWKASTLSHQLGVAHLSLPPPTQPSKRLGGCPRPARVTPRSDGPNPAQLPKGFQKETDCLFGEKKKTQMGIRKPSVYHKTVQIGNTSKLVLFILVLL